MLTPALERPRSPARVLITRSEPGASETARRVAALGHQAVVEPVFSLHAIQAPVPAFDALAFTSANGARGFAALQPRRDTPVFAVGARTAQAAHDAGFTQVESANGDVHALVDVISARLPPTASLLHAGNLETRGDLAGKLQARGFAASFLAIYEARPVAEPGPELAAHLRGERALEAVLIHSPRAAHIMAGLLGDSAEPCLSVVAISAAAAEPLRNLARRVETAASPDENSLMNALDRMMQA